MDDIAAKLSTLHNDEFPSFYQNVRRDGLSFRALVSDYYIYLFGSDQKGLDVFVLLAPSPFEAAYRMRNNLVWRADQDQKLDKFKHALQQRQKNYRAADHIKENDIILYVMQIIGMIHYYLPTTKNPWKKQRENFKSILNFFLPSLRVAFGEDSVCSAECENFINVTTSFLEKLQRNNNFFIGIAVMFTGILLVGYLFRSTNHHLPHGVTPFSTPVTENLATNTKVLNVNERSGPGVNFPPVEVIPTGSTITEIGRAIDSDGKPWLVVRRADGSYAFIKERLVHPELHP